MDVTLYSTHCPRCNVLEKKLEQNGIEYTVIDNENLIIEKGFQTIPMLEVDGDVMDFSKAIKWVNGVNNE